MVIEIMLVSIWAVALVLVVVIWRLICKLRQQLKIVQQKLVAKGEETEAIKIAAMPTTDPVGSTSIIEIELHNPLEVAENQIPIAGVAGVMAPTLIRKRVYQSLREQLANELQQRGIVATVSLKTKGS